MHALGEIIKKARTNLGMSQEKLASEASVSRVSIQSIETGKTGTPHAATLIAIARALGFSTWSEVAMSVAEPQAPNGHHGRIPILSQIPASWGADFEVNGSYNYEEAVDYLPQLPGVEDVRAFGLIITGDSMMPRYQDGEVVVCSPSDWHNKGFEDGRRYAIRFSEDVGGGTTVKRVHRVDDDHIDLIPENDRHPTKRVRDADVVLAAVIVGRYVKE
jgi:phage repressor protein C with HTH and peptisase S24 domain